MDRRGFFRGAGAAAVGVAAGVVGATKTVVEEVPSPKTEEMAIASAVYIQGDGTKDGDMRLVKIGGSCRTQVKRGREWILAFPA